MKKKKLLSVLVAAAMSCSLFSAVPIVSQAEEDTEYPEYTCGDYIYNIFEEGTCDIRISARIRTSIFRRNWMGILSWR